MTTPASEQAGRYQRSPSGLVGSMVVLLLVVGGFFVLRGAFRGNQDVPVQTVDYSLVLQQARRDASLLLPVPDPMPTGWRATSVRYVAATAGRGATWHLGILTDQETYVGIEEARATASTLAQRFLGKGVEQGTAVTVGGVSWTSWTVGDRYALTRPDADGTILVGGPAGRSAVLRLTGQLGVRG